MSLGIYIHIPFCIKKCKYCDFNSFDNINELKFSYKNALIKEINASNYNDIVDTVFIGGGTPTSLDINDLVDIITAINNKFNIKNAEFTVEVNPATLDYEGFGRLFESGVNRISFGLQSANDDELKMLGRIHTYNDFLTSYNYAIKSGFDNINVDLMFSLPNQTLSKWENTLSIVTSLSPQHLSCYSLIIEEGTPFYNMSLALPDEDTDRYMYDFVINYLAKKGYAQYEISNFAKQNMECKHNIKYWTRKNYIGFGAGAHSLYNDVRFENSSDVAKYITSNIASKNILSKNDIINEYIFLGMRMTDGIDLFDFKNRFGIDFKEKYSDIICKYESVDMLQINDRCSFTNKGISVSNSILCDFI